MHNLIWELLVWQAFISEGMYVVIEQIILNKTSWLETYVYRRLIFSEKLLMLEQYDHKWPKLEKFR